MIRTLRAFFLSRVLREKLLLVGFLGIAVVMWASSFSSRIGGFLRVQHTTAEQLKQQDYWLGQRDQIKTATEQAAGQMDPSRTLDPTGLSVAVHGIATDTGIKDLQTQNSEASTSGQFSINRLRIIVRNAEWHNFATFYQHLQDHAPYIAITDLTMQPVPRSPSQITASMTVASFEIRH